MGQGSTGYAHFAICYIMVESKAYERTFDKTDALLHALCKALGINLVAQGQQTMLLSGHFHCQMKVLVGRFLALRDLLGALLAQP